MSSTMFAQKKDEDEAKVQEPSQSSGSSGVVIVLIVMVSITWGIAATSYFGMVDYKTLISRMSYNYESNDNMNGICADVRDYLLTFDPVSNAELRHPLRSIGHILIRVDNYISNLFVFKSGEIVITDKRRPVISPISPARKTIKIIDLDSDFGDESVDVEVKSEAEKPVVPVVKDEPAQDDAIKMEHDKTIPPPQKPTETPKAKKQAATDNVEKKKTHKKKEDEAAPVKNKDQDSAYTLCIQVLIGENSEEALETNSSSNYKIKCYSLNDLFEIGSNSFKISVSSMAGNRDIKKVNITHKNPSRKFITTATANKPTFTKTNDKYRSHGYARITTMGSTPVVKTNPILSNDVYPIPHSRITTGVKFLNKGSNRKAGSSLSKSCSKYCMTTGLTVPQFDLLQHMGYQQPEQCKNCAWIPFLNKDISDLYPHVENEQPSVYFAKPVVANNPVNAKWEDLIPEPTEIPPRYILKPVVPTNPVNPSHENIAHKGEENKVKRKSQIIKIAPLSKPSSSTHRHQSHTSTHGNRNSDLTESRVIVTGHLTPRTLISVHQQHNMLQKHFPVAAFTINKIMVPQKIKFNRKITLSLPPINKPYDIYKFLSHSDDNIIQTTPKISLAKFHFREVVNTNPILTEELTQTQKKLKRSRKGGYTGMKVPGKSAAMLERERKLRQTVSHMKARMRSVIHDVIDVFDIKKFSFLQQSKILGKIESYKDRRLRRLLQENEFKIQSQQKVQFLRDSMKFLADKTSAFLTRLITNTTLQDVLVTSKDNAIIIYEFCVTKIKTAERKKITQHFKINIIYFYENFDKYRDSSREWLYRKGYLFYTFLSSDEDLHLALYAVFVTVIIYKIISKIGSFFMSFFR